MHCIKGAGIAQSVKRLATAWTFKGFSAPVQTGPGAHPSSYTVGTGSFPGACSRVNFTFR